MKKLAALTVLFLVMSVGGCTAMALLIGGAGTGQAATCTPPGTSTSTPSMSAGTSPTATISTTSTISTLHGVSSPVPVSGQHLPASIGAYNGEQIANAAQIILAAQALGIDARGQSLGVMTAIGESTLRNLGYGDAVGPDSRGLFQQRASGWGSLAERMNPRSAATSFFKELLDVAGWESMPPTLAAHAVQRNADPYHYAPYWADAVRIVSVLSGSPALAAALPATGELACAPSSAGSFTGLGPGAGGVFAPQPCTVVPDPTTGHGCLTVRTLALATQLKNQGWRLSCWDAHAWNPTSDHPLGRACDVFPGKGGVLPNPAQKANGDALAAALQASATTTGVHYLIWYGRIWDIERDKEGWRPYNGGGIYDPTDITGGHYDHIHVSLY